MISMLDWVCEFGRESNLDFDSFADPGRMVFDADYGLGSGHDFSFDDQKFDRSCYSVLGPDLKLSETLFLVIELDQNWRSFSGSNFDPNYSRTSDCFSEDR